MAVRFGVIFITDNGRTSEITAFMVFTNETRKLITDCLLGLSLLLATLTTLLILTIKLKN
ncbi:hypothetical protein HpBT152_11970 [Helicobacter pylori]